jgi:hypothetical protein
MPFAEFVLAYCAVVQGTTTKVRRAVAASNNETAYWIRGTLLTPIRLLLDERFCKSSVEDGVGVF